MRNLLALLLTTLLAIAPAAAQPFPQNSQGLVYSAFTPTGWATLSASTATGRVALGSVGAANTPFVAWVQNTGAVAANIVLGKDNTVVATLTSGTYVAAGQCVALNALGATYLAAITGSSTTTLNIMTGTGVPTACTGGGSASSNSNATIVSPLGPTTAAAASVAMVFGSGATLPAFAATPTFNVGTMAALVAGSAIIGNVRIDQTTPGTTNGVQVNAALPAGTNLIGKTGIDQTTPGTTNGVQITATTAVAPVVSATVESNHVLKGSAGSLISVSTTAGATAGFMMVFDATSAPVDGAVTPKYCIQVPANNFAAATWPTPASFATGITVVFSTTGCFTKTASATAFFSGQVQ